MSKDDLLFKNVMKIFTVIGVVGIGLPLLYFVVPGLVTSLLMLGAIIGFFCMVAKFANIAGSQQKSSSSRTDILKNSTYTSYPSGNVYAPGSSIKGTFD